MDEDMDVPTDRAGTTGFKPWQNTWHVEWMIAGESDDDLLVWVLCPQNKLFFTYSTIIF